MPGVRNPPPRKTSEAIRMADRTPLNRAQRAAVAGLHIEYKTDPNERKTMEREFKLAQGIGAMPPVERPGGTRRRRRSLQRKTRKNRRKE